MTSCDYYNTNTNSALKLTMTQKLHHGNSGSKLCQMQQPEAKEEQLTNNV